MITIIFSVIVHVLGFRMRAYKKQVVVASCSITAELSVWKEALLQTPKPDTPNPVLPRCPFGGPPLPLIVSCVWSLVLGFMDVVVGLGARVLYGPRLRV